MGNQNVHAQVMFPGISMIPRTPPLSPLSSLVWIPIGEFVGVMSKRVQVGKVGSLGGEKGGKVSVSYAFFLTPLEYGVIGSNDRSDFGRLMLLALA